MAYTVKNVARGPRGIHTLTGIHYLDPGQEVSVEMSDGDRDSATSSGYFEISGGDEPDRKAVIRSAINALSDDDDDHWTNDGRPDVHALNDHMPEGSERVTAAERDDAWSAMQAEAEH